MLRRFLSPRVQVAVGLVLMIVVIGVTSVVAASWQDNAAKKRATQSFREDLSRWREVRAGCARSVNDRRGSIRLLRLSARANQAVADDSVNTFAVRTARGREAGAQRSAVRGLRKRIPPRFTCSAAYPRPQRP